MENCMLCQSISETEFLKRDWSEYSSNFKFDGERILAKKQADRVILFNRRNTEKGFVYPEIVEALKKLSFDFIIDGEVVSFDEKFNSLQKRAGVRNPDKIQERVKEVPVKFMVFDILSIEGNSITNKPLKERIKELDKFKGLDNIEVVIYFDDINYLWEKAKKDKQEGIIIKKLNGYYEFRRSDNWIKLKNWNEIVIEFDSYVFNNSGIRLDNGFTKVQIQRLDLRDNIKARIDKGEKVKVNIQYLEKTEKNGKYRFPTFKELIK